MNAEEQIKKFHQMSEEWFREHVATQNEMGNDALGYPVRVINWRRPNTGSYAVRFVIYGNVVMVTGDLGEAIYAFGSILTLEFLTQTDWHYFINKCVASETGRQYTMKVPGIGRPIPNIRAIAHHFGLQAAIKQLHAPVPA